MDTVGWDVSQELAVRFIRKNDMATCTSMADEHVSCRRSLKPLLCNFRVVFFSYYRSVHCSSKTQEVPFTAPHPAGAWQSLDFNTRPNVQSAPERTFPTHGIQ
jgi:hypothetical protein